jgi:hypothetical protein
MRADSHSSPGCSGRSRLSLSLVLLGTATACGGSSASLNRDICSAHDARGGPALDWGRRFGGHQSHYVESIAVDPSGNTLVTGHVGGDLLVLKVSPIGEQLFLKRFESLADERGTRIVSDRAGHIIVAGVAAGGRNADGQKLERGDQMVLFQLDPAGGLIWSKTFGGPDDQRPWGLAVDQKGNIVVAGELQGSINFGGGPLESEGGPDIVVAKFDTDGNHLFSRRFGNAGYQYAHSVAVDASGDIALVGILNGALDFGRGVSVSTQDERDEILVAKLNASGDPLWAKCLGPSGFFRGFFSNYQHSHAIAMDTAGNILVTGAYSGKIVFDGPDRAGASLDATQGTDLFVAKLSPSGNHLWSRRLGGANTQTGLGIAAGSDSSLVVSGALSGTAEACGVTLAHEGAGDALVIKLDSAGNGLWTRRFGDDQTQRGEAVAVDPSGAVILAVSGMGAVDFGDGRLDTGGEYSIFLAKLKDPKRSLPRSVPAPVAAP